MPGENKPDSTGRRFLEINDFSPGLYDNSNISGFPGGGNTIPGIFPAPPGAADASVTNGCIAMPNGGLGPGPAIGGAPGTGGLSLLDIGISAVPTIDLICLTNTFQDAFDELIIGVNTSLGSSQTSQFYSYVVATASLNHITNLTSTFSAGKKNSCTYPFTTSLNVGSPLIQPVVVLPVQAPSSGSTSHLYVYPDPSAPTTFSFHSIATTECATGFGHQGRIVITEPLTAYGWPTPVTQFPNEAFSYTDPPLTQTWPHQYEVFGPESPFGYGAFSSVSAGELFCVKDREGGIVIQGDLNNPTVTQLPGVRSTGPFYGRTDTDQNGTYYCSLENGAWVWNGGNTSTKISTQLDDQFYVTESQIADTSYYGYYCQRWDSWMMFSNGYLYNTLTNSWWRLSAVPGKSFFWWVPGWEPRFMFSALGTIPDTSVPFLFEYDRDTPAPTYEWQSLPLRLPTEDRSTVVREIIVRASNPWGDTNPQIQVTLLDDATNSEALTAWIMTTGINTVQEIRLNAGTRSTTVAVNVVASGALYAPVIHSISVGYHAREHVTLA